MSASVPFPFPAPSAGGSASTVLFGLALLLLAAKAGGLLARRFGQPAVLGELLVGIVLGNALPPLFGAAGLEFVRTDPTLHVLAEVGVLLLLFDVGLEADLRGLRSVGLSALLVALLGVAAPFALGWGVAALLLPEAPVVAHVFVGASLTATSVGITARVLKDLGALQSREGQTILGAALLDDVLGLVILAVVSGMATGAGAGPCVVTTIVGKAVLFLGGAALLGHFLWARIARAVGRTGDRGLFLPLGLCLCFVGAKFAEVLGLAGILGAFAAGILLDPYGQNVAAGEEDHSLSELLHSLNSVFVPLFFVLTGVQVDLSVLMDGGALLLGGALVLAAIAGKLTAGLGVVGGGTRRIVVAIGMVPRGEVGLIFAGIGASLQVDGRPLLPPVVFSALVVMVLATTLVTPVALQRAVGRAAGRAAD